jgi:hypothetical protein
MCFNGIIHRLFKGTTVFLRTRITDIWWLKSSYANLFFKFKAVVITAITQFAILYSLPMAVSTTNVNLGTFLSMCAGVVTVCTIAGSFNNRMFSDLP